MTKPEPARYRTTNWKSCNDALKQRGSLLIWPDKDMVWLAIRAGRPGRPPVFSDAAIRFCLMEKVLFGLPLRPATGMVASILEMAGLDWPVPDVSTLSRRQKTLGRTDHPPPQTGAAEHAGGQHRDQVPGVKRDRGPSGAA